jgi:hypothetical protein
MAFHHHDARGLPGSDGTKKHNLHFADLLLWLRPLKQRPIMVRRQCPNQHSQGRCWLGIRQRAAREK